MKTFIVLGMHRSATSLIAGGLQKMGVDIGERLLGKNFSNPKGHFENLDFLYLNRKILSLAGGSWDNPPDEEKILEAGEQLKNEIKETIDKNKSKLWGWKDPRTTLTIKVYLPYLENPHFICIFRDPLEVAKSLNRRDKISIEKGIELANEYNHRLIKFLQYEERNFQKSI